MRCSVVYDCGNFWIYSLCAHYSLLILFLLYLGNKETQQTHWFIVSKQYDASFSANDINSWKQHVFVKLQQVQSSYWFRNRVGMHVTSLTPVVNCWNKVKKSKIWINNRFVVLKSLCIDCGSWKSSAGPLPEAFWNNLTLTLNTALNA